MIVMDPPRQDTFRERVIWTAHLVSSRFGPEGTEELLAFGRTIGMDPAWIQHPGTAREHFDLMGQARMRRAQAAGALVDRRMLGLILRAKRINYERCAALRQEDGTMPYVRKEDLALAQALLDELGPPVEDCMLATMDVPVDLSEAERLVQGREVVRTRRAQRLDASLFPERT